MPGSTIVRNDLRLSDNRVVAGNKIAVHAFRFLHTAGSSGRNIKGLLQQVFKRTLAQTYLIHGSSHQGAQGDSRIEMGSDQSPGERSATFVLSSPGESRVQTIDESLC